MKFTETFLKDCYIIEPKVLEDARGYFMEAFHESKFYENTFISTRFVQDNESQSNYGVLRGLHIQRGEHSQAKLVRVLHGTILDVAVDVRKSSPTFGQYFSIELSAENKKQLFIPRGFLHGFSVLSETATVFYKCDSFYNQKSEDGVNPLDLGIDWKLPKKDMILSEKDKIAQAFSDFIPFES